LGSPHLGCLDGNRYGRLVVIRDVGYSDRMPCGSRRRLVLCRCDCGKELVVAVFRLRSAKTVSCGCKLRENQVSLGKWARINNRKHGMYVGDKPMPTYVRWMLMMQRCYNKKHVAYHNYGGRGIRVCDEWKKSPSQFAIDVGSPPFQGATLDRIDNNAGYSKENVRWSTRKQQANNTRRNCRVEINGVTKTVSEWADFAETVNGLNKNTVQSRFFNLGWDMFDAVTISTHHKNEKVEQ
jgi:hypothetical protein